MLATLCALLLLVGEDRHPWTLCFAGDPVATFRTAEDAERYAWGRILHYRQPRWLFEIKPPRR